MKQNQKSRNKNYKAAGISLGTISAVVIAVMFVFFTAPRPQLVTDDGEWHVIWHGNLVMAAENTTIAADEGGFLEILWLNHTATPATAYDVNDSSVMEGWADANNLGYANADNFSVELAHTTTWDIVVRCQFNSSQCNNGELSRVRCAINITAGDNVMGGGTNATGRINTSYGAYNNMMWVNFYWTNGGAGYSLSPDGGDTYGENNGWGIIIEARY